MRGLGVSPLSTMRLLARAICHECDHLDGIVFLEKVKEKNGFATQENINKYNLRNI